MTDAEKTLTATVAAAGFAVTPIPPALPSHKRLLADWFLVDTEDGILNYATAEDVQQSHMVDGSDDDDGCYWSYSVVGIYQVKAGALTACDLKSWEQQATQEQREAELNRKYYESLRYE